MENEIMANEKTLDDDTLWTVEEVAKFIKLKPETVRKMARRGDLPAIKIRRMWRFKKSSVMKLVSPL